MIQSILIANRSEIAVRIIRACKTLGIRAVLACSEADKESLAAHLADQVVCIGPPQAKESYLNHSAIISAAILAHCDAIHPGVGFLSENAAFARRVHEAGLIFIGPSADTIELLGNKIQAKRTAASQGLPLIPGTPSTLSSVTEAMDVANDIGYPVLLKAASGGGGKGIRVVHSPNLMQEVFSVASTEALQSFGDGSLYLEQYFENPRHVEVQIIVDGKGNVVHLGERDCTVQFQHQKIIEESPSPSMSDEVREKMCMDTVRLMQSLDYRGAGTVEYLFNNDQYYFMEVNTRVQVEHPISELRSNIDIVYEQIRACNDARFPFTQDSIHIVGSSMECRINARTPGKVLAYHAPGGFGVRVDSMLYPGYTIPPYYDSLLAKIIVYASDRTRCIEYMLAALDELKIEGVQTNIDEHKKILRHPLFLSGNFGTNIYETIFNGDEG